MLQLQPTLCHLDVERHWGGINPLMLRANQHILSHSYRYGECGTISHSDRDIQLARLHNLRHNTSEHFHEHSRDVCCHDWFALWLCRSGRLDRDCLSIVRAELLL